MLTSCFASPIVIFKECCSRALPKLFSHSVTAFMTCLVSHAPTGSYVTSKAAGTTPGSVVHVIEIPLPAPFMGRIPFVNINVFPEPAWPVTTTLCQKESNRRPLSDRVKSHRTPNRNLYPSTWRLEHKTATSVDSQSERETGLLASDVASGWSMADETR